MQRIRTTFALIFLVSTGFSQTIPSNRIVDWSVAGMQNPVPSYSNVVDITTFGGVGDGVTNNSAFLANAIASLGGNAGVISFPKGVFRFTSSVSLADSVIIRGAASDSTTLLFDQGGVLNHSFNVYGTQGSTVYSFTTSSLNGTNVISLNQVNGIQPGDWLRIYFDDSALVVNSWAYTSVGQIVKVQGVNGNQVTISGSFRRDYLFADSCKAVEISPISGVGFECFKIKRNDATTQQTQNIDFDRAVNCWVMGIESDSTNFAHIALNYCSNILITENYFHHSHAYGGGGQGYGIVSQFATGECLIVNNIFKHLRHSMILQAGANGNVYAYNYSTDPFWVQSPFPAAAAGDLVLHGNHVFANLFEGNMVQNMVIDDSHGKNGPYNTFFRNRGELYGLVMNNNPATNDQNFVGNEITNNGQGLYLLNGTNHFQYGNNVKGTITPAGPSTMPDSTYYLSAKPSFFTGPWPSVGIPNAINSGTIPAKTNWLNGQLTSCSLPVTGGTEVKELQLGILIYPNPAQDHVIIKGVKGLFQLLDISGKVVMRGSVRNPERIDLSGLSEGVYSLVMLDGKERILKKLVIMPH